MNISNDTLYNFINESMSRFARCKDPDAKQAVLAGMEETLRLLNDLQGREEAEELSTSGNVVWALDPQNAPWAAAGVSPAERLGWKAYGVDAPAAGAWTKLGVSPGVACLFTNNRVTPTLYELWADFYKVDVSVPLDGQQDFLNEVMEFLAAHTTTPAQSKKWLEAGIPLRDIHQWKLLGQTPAGAKKKIEENVGLADLAGEEAPVPGTSYPKAMKMAEKAGWVAQPAEKRGRYSSVDFTKGGSKVAVRFSPTGRLSTFYASGDVAAAMNSQDSSAWNFGYKYFYGRGIKVLEEIFNL